MIPQSNDKNNVCQTNKLSRIYLLYLVLLTQLDITFQLVEIFTRRRQFSDYTQENQDKDSSKLSTKSLVIIERPAAGLMCK